MWISRAKAIERMRAETGLSEEYCRSLVMKLKTHPEGVYKKVLEAEVAELIKTENTPAAAFKGKQLSKSQVLRIQTAGI